MDHTIEFNAAGTVQMKFNLFESSDLARPGNDPDEGKMSENSGDLVKEMAGGAVTAVGGLIPPCSKYLMSASRTLAGVPLQAVSRICPTQARSVANRRSGGWWQLMQFF